MLDVGANIAYVRCHLTHLVGRDGRVFAVGSDPVPADLALMAHIQQKGREAGHGGYNTRYPRSMRERARTLMFTLTESATVAINSLTTDQNVRKEGGLRMTLDGLPEEGAALSVEITAHAAPGDDVVEVSGTQVFLARETRVRLTDKILDVRKDIDGHFTFLVKSR